MVFASHGLDIVMFAVELHGLYGQGSGSTMCSLVLAVLGVAMWLNPNKLRGLNSLAHVIQWLAGI